MIIDFHTHTFKDSIAKKALESLKNSSDINPCFDGTYNGLIKLMDESNIDYSISLPVATNPLKVESINDYSICQNNMQKRIIYFGAMHPKYINYKTELKRLKENGIIGIKIHPVYQECPIDSKEYIDIINEANTLGLYIIIHAGFDPKYPGSDFSSVDRILNLLSKLTSSNHIILAHLGALMEWDQVYDKLCGKDLYLDTAISFYEKDSKPLRLNPISDELLYKIINKHGSDKILFGTDSPWMDPKSMINYFNNLDLDLETKNKILYKNAINILGGNNVL